MDKNPQNSDPPKDEQAVDASEYNSPGVVFSKPTSGGGEDNKLSENAEKSIKDIEREQEETPPEYSNKIKPLRTYEKDLEEAKRRAGVSGDTEDDISTKREAVEVEKSAPTVPTEREQKTLRRQIEQELAKSGIVPQAEKDTPEVEEDKTSLKTVRTYRDDATSSIQNKNLSVVSIAAAESKKRAAQKRRLRPERADKPSTFLKSLTIVVVSLTLIASGVAVSAFFYKASKEGTGIEANEEITSFIFADEQKEIDISELSRASLLERLNSERLEVNTKLGGVVHLLLTEKGLSGVQSSASAERFLRRIGGSVPNRLVRSLDDEFMLGVHALGGNHPFLVFKTQSFENTFASMLDWEDTMNRDLSPLFGDTLSEIATKGASRIFIPRIFNDVIVRNNDTRILRDDRGGIALIYGFPSVDTIIIATNENTFFEVFKRLTVTKSEN